MLKWLKAFFLTFTFLFAVMANLGPAAAQSKPPRAKPTPTPQNAKPQKPEIGGVIADDNIVYTLCPGSARHPLSGCTPEQMIVNVVTTAKNVTGDLEYYYVVTGGTITGSGAHVKWDLTEPSPGKYTLTVGIGKDNVILSDTASTSVTKEWCPCDPGCSCPSISMTSPSGPANPGDTVVFESNVRLPDGNSTCEGPIISYSWSVSDGKILNDPANSSIMVKIPPDFKLNQIQAIFTLTGTDPACGCQREGIVIIAVGPSTKKSGVPQLK